MASCRACGNEMQQVALCPTCEEGVQWKCISCSKETDISVHTHDGRVIQPKVVDAVRSEATSVTTA